MDVEGKSLPGRERRAAAPGWRWVNRLSPRGLRCSAPGLIGQRLDSLDRLAQAAQVFGADREGRDRLPEIRNHAIAALGLIDLRVRRQHDNGDVFDVNADAAVERYAVVENSGETVVRRLDDDRELARLPGPERSGFWYAWSTSSPDGELLAAAYTIRTGETLVRVWHLGRQELLGSVTGQGIPAFHPDSRRLLFGAAEGGIAVWDSDLHRVVRRLPLDFTPHWLAVDPARQATRGQQTCTGRKGLCARAARDPRSRDRPRALRPGVPGGRRCDRLERRWATAGRRRHQG